MQNTNLLILLIQNSSQSIKISHAQTSSIKVWVVFIYLKKTLPRSAFMFNECFVYLKWRKHNRTTTLIRNRIVFLDFQTCLSLKQERSLHSIVNMINCDLSHMLPRLEELLNLQILPSHVTESDTIHLRKIATPKCLFWPTFACQGSCKLFASKCPETISDARALLLSKLFKEMFWVQPGRDLSSTPHTPTFRGICMPDWDSEERQLLPTNNPSFLLSLASRHD